jgi:hypothetical protein
MGRINSLASNYAGKGTYLRTSRLEKIKGRSGKQSAFEAERHLLTENRNLWHRVKSKLVLGMLATFSMDLVQHPTI